MVLSAGATEKSPVTPRGIDPGTVQLVAQRLNHYATPGTYRGEKIHNGFWCENLKERGHMKDLGVGGRIILNCILQKQNEKNGLD